MNSHIFALIMVFFSTITFAKDITVEVQLTKTENFISIRWVSYFPVEQVWHEEPVKPLNQFTLPQLKEGFYKLEISLEVQGKVYFRHKDIYINPSKIEDTLKFEINPENMVFTEIENSPINKDYHVFLNKMDTLNYDKQILANFLSGYLHHEEEVYQIAFQRYQKLQNDIIKLKKELIAKYPNSILQDLLLPNQELLKDKDTYWDAYDMSNPILCYSPIYANAINGFAFNHFNELLPGENVSDLKKRMLEYLFPIFAKYPHTKEYFLAYFKYNYQQENDAEMLYFINSFSN